MKKVKILTLDTETYNGLIGKLKRIAVYDGKRVYYGYNFQDVEKVIENYKFGGYRVHVYIHNMEFDLRKIPVVFESDRVEWGKSLIINNNLVKLVSNDVVYQDSFALLPSSLAALSKDFEVEHGKIDLWDAVKKMYPGEYRGLVDFLDRCDIDNELFLEYLGYDVISLYEVIYKIIDMLNIDISRFVNIYTSASLSRYIFKHGYNGDGVDKYTVFKSSNHVQTDYQIMTLYDWKKNLEVEEIIRLAYCGGRCEVFKPLLKCRGFYYDYNSLYPFVMLENDYPVGKPEYTANEIKVRKSFERFKRMQKKGVETFGFLNCRVYIPKQNIPPLPVKMGKLTFPTGDIYGIWTFQELDYAIENCGVIILEYYASITFSLKYPVFRNFVEVFGKMKEDASIEGRKALKNIIKRILNVGYGYTGMSREDKYELDNINNIGNYNPEDVHFVDRELGYIEVPAEIDADYIQPQIAAYVTSYARLLWLKTAKYIESQGGNVYYGDTDSLVTDMPLPDFMVDDNKLGKLALEHVIGEGIFIKPKVYAIKLENLQEVMKFKGVSKDTVNDMDYNYYIEMYKKMVAGESGLVVEKNKTVLRSLMYLTKNHISYDNFEIRDKKIYFDRREKRIMDFENNSSEPWYFETIDKFEKFDYNNNDDVVLDNINNYTR